MLLKAIYQTLIILKKRPGDQYLFINNRPIKSRMVQNSIISSFSSLIQRGEYPFYCLNIKAAPNLYDINVHPMKKKSYLKKSGK